MFRFPVLTTTPSTAHGSNMSIYRVYFYESRARESSRLYILWLRQPHHCVLLYNLAFVYHWRAANLGMPAEDLPNALAIFQHAQAANVLPGYQLRYRCCHDYDSFRTIERVGETSHIMLR
jgi:hypothetical protein